MKRLNEITRTEIFFTSSLHYACVENPDAVLSLLTDKLDLCKTVTLIDSGYEICLFRDFAKADLMTRPKDLGLRKSIEKQTFDNVFILSNDSIVLVEAKANQRFNKQQIEQLNQAKKFIKSSKLPWDKVFLLGLHSSKYNPTPETKSGFDATVTWSELAEKVESKRSIFQRADEIFND